MSEVSTAEARRVASALPLFAQTLVDSLCDALDGATTVIDGARVMAAEALGLEDPMTNAPLLGEAIKRLAEQNRAADGAAIDLAERLDKAERLADELRGDVRQAERQRDAMAKERADAIDRIPALRAKVAADAELRPEFPAATDEDIMASLIIVASDVRRLLLQEKERTAELRAIVTDVIAQLESGQGSPIPARFTVRDAVVDLRARLAALDTAAGR